MIIALFALTMVPFFLVLAEIKMLCNFFEINVLKEPFRIVPTTACWKIFSTQTNWLFERKYFSFSEHTHTFTIETQKEEEKRKFSLTAKFR